MFLKICLLVLSLILLFWILGESIGYVPTNMMVPDAFSYMYQIPKAPEAFTASIINQKIPSMSGDDSAVMSVLDSDILRTQRITNGNSILSKTKELDFYQMNDLVKQILGDARNSVTSKFGNLKFISVSLDDTDRSTSSATNIALEKGILHLRAAINSKILMSKYNSYYHAFEPLDLLAFTITEKLISTSSSDIFRYKINLHMGRPNKVQTFIFYADFITDSSPNSIFYELVTLEIIGTPVEHLGNIVDDKYRNALLGLVQPSLENVYVNFPIIGSANQPNDDITIFENKQKYGNELKLFKCFHPNGIDGELKDYTTQLACESYHPEVAGFGVWDNPCKSDSECPYWRSNKNYTNNLGGCDTDTGKCNMPFGVLPVGYKKYSQHSKPACYTPCGTNDAPDYIFSGDSNIRKARAIELNARGLEVNPML